MRSLEKLNFFVVDADIDGNDCGIALDAVFIIIDAQRLAMFKV